MPDYYFKYLNGGVKSFPDFTKRMACLRELFEECNLLLAAKNGSDTPSQNYAQGLLREQYVKHYGGNFIKFCKNENLFPSLNKFLAFCRIGSPIGFYPANDTQFYMYFCDD